MHDAIQVISTLTQCLSQNRRPLSLFLGAGCAAALRVTRDGQSYSIIPAIAGLTSHVSSVAEKTSVGPHFKVLSSQLQADLGRAPNIEDLLSRVRSLLAVVGTDEVRGLRREHLQALDVFICKEIGSLVNRELPEEETCYDKVARWIGAGPRVRPIEVFTTNYDLLLEQALERSGVPYFDGFPGSLGPTFNLATVEADDLPVRWAKVWKLHGSLNWALRPSGAVCRMGYVSDKSDPPIIHPSHLKYTDSKKMPYLALVDRLSVFGRRESAVMMVCGYSFGDEHLNEVMVQGLQSNAGAVVIALQYGKIAGYPAAQELARRNPGLMIIAEDAAVIGGKEAAWDIATGGGRPRDIADRIIWQDAESAGAPGWRPSVKLGDFANFATFLASIVALSPSASMEGRQ